MLDICYLVPIYLRGLYFWHSLLMALSMFYFLLLDSLPNIGIPESDSKECDFVPKEVLFALTRVSDLSSPKPPEPTKRQTDLEAVAVCMK